MITEVYVADCCGTVFAPGFGPDDIVEDDDPENVYDAYRDGHCPVCDAYKTGLTRLFRYPDDFH